MEIHYLNVEEGDCSIVDVLRPKLSLLGNAKSQHLDYHAWSVRRLDHYTNNQLGSIILEETRNGFDVYATCKNAVVAYHQGLCPNFTEAMLKPHAHLSTYYLKTV